MKRIIAGALLAATLAMPTYAEAQENKDRKVSGSIEQVIQEEAKKSYPRIKLFYDLPAGIEGFSFMEFYPTGDGYAGRTSLSRKIARGFSSNAEIEHFKEPFTHAAFGVSYAVPVPKRASLSFGISPIAIDKKGDRVKERVVASFGASVNLGKGFSLSSFGEYNLASTTWLYGEVEVAKAIGKHMELSYNPSLLTATKGEPYLNHRISIEVKF